NKYKPADGTYVPTLTFTEDELGKISEIRTTLKTYVKECETRFITRDMSIESDWETYLGELDRIGLNELLTVFQSAYDRLYAVK
ncbi:MAG: ABC transporter substrate-binding protein, partial [Clostridia bacterium]